MRMNVNNRPIPSTNSLGEHRSPQAGISFYSRKVEKGSSKYQPRKLGRIRAFQFRQRFRPLRSKLRGKLRKRE